jgi:acetone carboxylase, beta subunit
MPKPQFVAQRLEGPDPSHAHVGKRHVLWGSRNGEAQVYRWESLRPGNRIEGCALLEGLNTTYFVPEGWVMVFDGHRNGKLSRA